MPATRDVEVEVLPKGHQPPPPRGPQFQIPADPLAALIARLMDSLFKVPGTNIKVGLDPVIGLIPGLGSGASALISIALLVRAATMRVPNLILLQMGGNILLNSILNAIPILGDAASVFYRSNQKNYELLQKHAGTRRAATTKDWLLLGGIIFAIFAVVGLIFVGLVAVVAALTRAVTG